MIEPVSRAHPPSPVAHTPRQHSLSSYKIVYTNGQTRMFSVSSDSEAEVELARRLRESVAVLRAASTLLPWSVESRKRVDGEREPQILPRRH